MSVAFINGEFVPVEQKVLPIDERGHQFGDGVYEVIRVYAGSPFMLREHLQRLARSAAAIQLQLNYSPDELEQYIGKGLEQANESEAEVYIQVTRGITPRQHLFPNASASTTMTIRPARNVPQAYWENGVSVALMDDERWANCFIKSLNLLPNVLAKQTAANAGHYEAVFVQNGYITEGSSSNVFVVKAGKLLTPRNSKKILSGITRAALLELALELGIPAEEADISVEDLKAADELFITSTTMEVMPVHTIDQQPVNDGKPGPITRQLQQAYQQLYRKMIVG